MLGFVNAIYRMAFTLLLFVILEREGSLQKVFVREFQIKLFIYAVSMEYFNNLVRLVIYINPQRMLRTVLRPCFRFYQLSYVPFNVH